MKKKQVLALAMASAMVFSLATGQVAFAAQDGESVVSEITQDADNGTEETEDQAPEDSAKDQDETDTEEVADNQDTEDLSDQKETEEVR